MKRTSMSHLWKRSLCIGLSLTMAASLFSSDLAAAAPTGSAAVAPTPVKAGSIPMPDDHSTRVEREPFAAGTAGSENFRIPAMITMENGELLALADARYTQFRDGDGLDTIASISGDGGMTWEYDFPFFFPDSEGYAEAKSTAFIDPGLVEGPDGTIYCFADAFPTGYKVAGLNAPTQRTGTGYVEIDGKQRLAVTDKWASSTDYAPSDTDDAHYAYYVGDFDENGYAKILKRADHTSTGYGVDEWYNIYSIKDGVYVDDLKQQKVNGSGGEIQQNLYYEGSRFHVFRTGYLWMITSKDHGRTWEHPTNIISQIKRDNEKALLVSPGRGLTTKDGTIVIGLYYHGTDENGGAEAASIMYSNDEGKTWGRTEDIVPPDGSGISFSSENEIIELADGTLRMFFRNGSGRIAYADFTKKADGEGYDVHTPVKTDVGVDSACNVTAIIYSQKINGKQAVLVSCPGAYKRKNGKIFTFLVNEDEGQTISLIHTFSIPGSESDYQYSSLTELEDGSVGLLWETKSDGTEVHYDRFSIYDLVPDSLALKNVALDVAVEKGETYSRSYNVTADAQDISPKGVDLAVASVKVEDADVFDVKIPAYNYSGADASKASLAVAYDTQSSAPQEMNLTDAEVTFTPAGGDGQYYVYNAKNDTYLRLPDTGVGGMTAGHYFGEKAGITMVKKDDGTYRMKPSETNKPADSYAIYFTDHKNFNRSGLQSDGTENSAYIYGFTLWERADRYTQEGSLPGYKRAETIAEGKKYLLTVEVTENDTPEIILLYPENGVTNLSKLIGDATEAKADVVRTRTVSITGVSEGSTKAEIDGVTYFIKSEDHSDTTHILRIGETYRPSGEATAEEEEAYKTFGEDDVIKIGRYAKPNGKAPLYNHVSSGASTASSLTSFTMRSDNEISLSDAEYVFTKSGENTWKIYNGKKKTYLNLGTASTYFGSAADVTVEKSQKDGGDVFFHLRGSTNCIFYYPKMDFNGWSQAGVDNPDFSYDMVLLESRGELSKDDVLPGYIRAAEIEEGKTYLIGYIWTDSETGAESIIVLYPENGTANQTKLAGNENAPIYGHISGTPVASSLDSFQKTAYRGESLSDAEFVFTRTDAGMEIFNEKKNVYLTLTSATNYFGDASLESTAEINKITVGTVAAGEKSYFRFNRAINTSNQGYSIFYFPQMLFERWGNNSTLGANGSYDMTLLEKQETISADDILPGYARVESITSGKTYLITYIWKDSATGKESVIVLYPENSTKTDNLPNGESTKLADKMAAGIEMIAQKAGTQTISFGGKEYTFKVLESEGCAHQNTTVKGAVSADNCHYVAGYSGDTVCSDCGETVSRGEYTYATGHEWKAETEYEPVTETKNGQIIYSCKNCSRTKTVTVYASILKRMKSACADAAALFTKESLYKASDVAGLRAAYDAAEKIDPAKKTGNAQMTEAAHAIGKAREKTLRTRAELEAAHEAAVTKARPIKEAGKASYYTQESWNTFETAYANADADISETAYIALETAVSKLEEAVAVLERQKSKSALQELYDTHKGKEKNDYSEKTWAVFEKALNDAKLVLEKDAPKTEELTAAKDALQAAADGLKTKAQEAEEITLTAPSLVYQAPSAGAYPKAASVTIGGIKSKHASDLLDRTEEVSTLEKNGDGNVEIVNQDNIWGFNGEVKSEAAKYDVFGDGKALAVTFKLYLKQKLASGTVDVLAKGHQYAFQLQNGELLMFMKNTDNKWPTEKMTVGDALLNKWLDIVMVIDGNGKQRFYVDGTASVSRDDKVPANIAHRDRAFSIGYNEDESAGREFKPEHGYLADIKFYACGDVTNGMANDYEAICNLLEAQDPTAYVTASPYDVKTVWSIAGGDGSDLPIEWDAKFATDTSYKAVTTFTAYDDFEFPDTQEFLEEVKGNVITGKADVVPTVAVSQDKKTMTVTVAYMQTGSHEKTEMELAQERLDAAVAAAAGIYDAGQKDYTTKSWTAFTAAYEAAKNPDEGLDAAGIRALAEALSNAQRSLVRFTVEDAEEILNAAVNAAKEIYEGGGENYTKDSWAAFVAAYEAAKNPGEGLSAEDIQALGEALTKAQNDLVRISIDDAMQKVEQAVKDAESLYNAGQGDYPEDVWNAFKEAYEAASNPQEGLSAARLEALANALTEAKEALQNSGSVEDPEVTEAQTKLAASIAAAHETYTAGNRDNVYTADSWKAFEDAYAAANEGKGGTDITVLAQLKEALDTAFKDLKKAEKPPVDDPNKKPADNTNTQPTLKKGDYADKGGVRYEVVDPVKRTAAAKRGLNKKQSGVTVVSSITIKGVSCKVAEISANAFKNFNKLTKVTVNANVTKIGKQSFSGCKKLKNISIKGAKITSVGKNAFKGTNAKLKIKLSKLNKKTKRAVIKKLRKGGNKKAVIK